MKKTRGKSLKAKKYVSFMVVPHNSDKVIKWKIANVYSKLFILIALFMIIVLAFSFTNISNFPDTRRRRKGKGTKKGSPGRIAKGNPHFLSLTIPF